MRACVHVCVFECVCVRVFQKTFISGQFEYILDLNKSLWHDRVCVRVCVCGGGGVRMRPCARARVCVYAYACVRAYVCASVRACVRTCVHAWWPIPGLFCLFFFVRQ